MTTSQKNSQNEKALAALDIARDALIKLDPRSPAIFHVIEAIATLSQPTTGDVVSGYGSGGSNTVTAWTDNPTTLTQSTSLGGEVVTVEKTREDLYKRFAAIGWDSPLKEELGKDRYTTLVNIVNALIQSRVGGR